MVCHPKMHPHTKFGIPTSKNIGDMQRTQSGKDGRIFYYYKNYARGQGHSDPKMVHDTPPYQDASTHQIWNSYLKEYRRYAPDMKRDGWTVRLLYASQRSSQRSFGGIKNEIERKKQNEWANSVDPDAMAHMSHPFWIYTVCPDLSFRSLVMKEF